MTIRFGIVGCGYIANRHARHIVDHPSAELIAAYDLDAEKGQRYAREYGAACAPSLEELVSNPSIDILTVCTPNGNHHEIAIQALKGGKHVLVEKPMALSKAQCQLMIDAAEANDRLLFVVKQNRFNPPVQALKRLIDEGRLGKIFMVNLNCYWNRNEAYYNDSEWKGTKALDGGTLFTQFSHFVDIFYYLFGDIEPISGITANQNHEGLIDFEDTGCFTFRFNSGALGNFAYTTAAFDRNMEGSISVFAENATIKIGGKYLNTIDYQATNGFDVSDLPISSPANNYGHYEGSMSNHDKIIRNVVETLNGRESIMTNAYEGMKVVEIIEKFYRIGQVKS